MDRISHNDDGVVVVDDRIAEILRGKTPAERIVMRSDAFETGRALPTAGIRHFHPHWTEEQVARAVNERLLGDAS